MIISLFKWLKSVDYSPKSLENQFSATEILKMNNQRTRKCGYVAPPSDRNVTRFEMAKILKHVYFKYNSDGKTKIQPHIKRSECMTLERVDWKCSQNENEFLAAYLQLNRY